MNDRLLIERWVLGLFLITVLVLIIALGAIAAISGHWGLVFLWLVGFGINCLSFVRVLTLPSGGEY